MLVDYPRARPAGVAWTTGQKTESLGARCAATSSVMSRGTSHATRAWATYGVMLALPLLALAILGRHDLAEWSSSGLCPGGPMDRPARPCGLLGIFALVFLGGWVGFIVVPLWSLWVAVCTVALSRALRRPPQIDRERERPPHEPRLHK
jgi:hypothetical protein